MVRKGMKVLLGAFACVLSILCCGAVAEAQGLMEEQHVEKLELVEKEELEVVGDVTSEDGEWVYRILEDGTAEITSYSKYSYGTELDIVEIPSVIDGITVTSILAIDVEPQKLILPETVTNINKIAVYYDLCRCNEVIVEEGNDRFVMVDGILYTSDTQEMIWCARNKTDLVIPEGIVSLGTYSIYHCNDLRTIEIPSTVTGVAEDWTYSYEIYDSEWYAYAFGALSSLQSISVASDNITYTSINGLLCNKDKTELIRCPSSVEDLVIPEGITFVWEFAHDLNSIEYPFSVTEIMNDVSVDTLVVKNPKCTIERVDDIKLIKGWDNSEAQAYATENSITFETLGLLEYDIRIKEDGTVQVVGMLNEDTEVVIPDEILEIKVTGIGGIQDVVSGKYKGTFADVTKMILPEGIVDIDDYAFMNGKLQYINFPTTLKRIGERVFQSCDLSGEIVLPSNIESIGAWAFLDASSMTKITIEEGVTEFGEGTFSDCTGITNVVLPSSLTEISDKLFLHCSGLESITIPNTITKIGYGAFAGCQNLKKLELPASVTYVDNTAFSRGDYISNVGKGWLVLTVNNPTCEFYDSAYTLLYVKTIIGYENSTAHAYALKYGKEFIDIENPFADVSKTGWEFPYAKWAVENNVMVGKGTDEYGRIIFGPSQNLTREQFVQVLYNNSGRPSVADVENKFSDVKDDWYTNAVLWASEEGIVSGYPNGNFGVGEDITREQLALMLYRYAEMYDYDMTVTEGLHEQFADGTKVSDWAENAVNWAITQGIISGKGTGSDLSKLKIDPQGAATRAECAAMMMKLLNKNS